MEFFEGVDDVELHVGAHERVQDRLVSVVKDELLSARPKVGDHGLEAFGRGEVCRRDVSAVEDDGDHA